LWGPEFLTVGGEEAITELIHPLTLNSNMSVLELGAGIGGATRHIHKATGAWVTGVENSVTLAKLGMEKSIMKGLQRKASVEHGDYTHLKVKPQSEDAVLAKEALFTVADKTPLSIRFWG
jgi:cyclopropane fatty-acyl-phospholipid synthase-like methyltransferase